MSAPCADSFQNVVELLDDLFQRAAAAAEPEDQNYIRWAPLLLDNKVRSAGWQSQGCGGPCQIYQWC